ncbi:hypothetical protein H9N28_14875 [Rhodobacter capsulatus]|uniref:Lipoprotein n=1 Tax=Rhodobacter capsulatus TaxID=1061 RepID=A0A0Q0QN58_RHOCA|nr:hypothetical protein [Rhodobacter capsulatus]KQB12862.1 hypothetical protein AP071_05530 [Rhodobacter capsulatus]KQB13089.1 hypothetical protein AP073_05250 [Rhodobacter capsulatus]PZX28536.1 hypothetical protein LY44_00282 [Rhodobacter capsulatus]QNR62814.1 hypothetical protein H9N28_14875 [Rhodobacter capsulatus]WER08878.1 hypothetical protein PUH89_16450 [Rhodobacter capsulatus]
MLRPALILPLALAACSAAPGTDFPKLVPAETLLVEEPLSPSPAPGLEARAEALRARAEALRAETP